MTVVKEVHEKLQAAGYQSPQLWSIASWIACSITKRSATEISTRAQHKLSHTEKQQLDQIIHDLTTNHKPLAYILGTTPFCTLELEIKEPILIPRPETEEWVLKLISLLSKKHNHTPKHILDIGTGSGCIALALARAYPNAHVIATDSSAQALALARRNQKQLAIPQVSFIEADLFPASPHMFDVIVSNPPYISEEVWQKLEPSVRTWEDKQALVAADNGRALIKRIIRKAHEYLMPGGLLVIEIGYDQADLYTFMKSCGYTDVQVWCDFAQQPRVLMGSHELAQN